jgi:Na+/H+-dicarboxylate symporter
MFRKMPVLLLLVILVIALLNPFIPLLWKSFFYALSLTIKSVIIFVLPLLIFMLLFKTMATLTSKATKIIFLLLGAIVISNFCSTILSYFVGHGVYMLDLSLSLPAETEGLQPLWNFSLPKWIGNDIALFAGLFLGILLSRFRPEVAKRVALSFEGFVKVLLRFLMALIPIFIAGFIMKLIQDKVLENMIVSYARIFAIVGLAQFAYIFFLYFSFNNFQIKRALACLKNMLPATISGFGSMSSAAALPLTLMATEKNTEENLARLVIPATVNVHLIGDCLAIPIFAFAVLKTFGLPEPTFLTYCVFAFYFVIAKFSVAAIPGGGIIVMLPILESVLGFHSSMSSLITALYIFFDPVITAANITGNGAFALLIHRIRQKILT